MKRFFKYPEITLLSVLLVFFTSCSTSQISVNKNEIKKIKTIAIMKFDSGEGVDKKVSKDCEESFKGHFISIGKNVVEREKLNTVI